MYIYIYYYTYNILLYIVIREILTRKRFVQLLFFKLYTHVRMLIFRRNIMCMMFIYKRSS